MRSAMSCNSTAFTAPSKIAFAAETRALAGAFLSSHTSRSVLEAAAQSRCSRAMACSTIPARARR